MNISKFNKEIELVLSENHIPIPIEGSHETEIKRTQNLFNAVTNTLQSSKDAKVILSLMNFLDKVAPATSNLDPRLSAVFHQTIKAAHKKMECLSQDPTLKNAIELENKRPVDVENTVRKIKELSSEVSPSEKVFLALGLDYSQSDLIQQFKNKILANFTEIVCTSDESLKTLVEYGILLKELGMTEEQRCIHFGSFNASIKKNLKELIGCAIALNGSEIDGKLASVILGKLMQSQKENLKELMKSIISLKEEGIGGEVLSFTLTELTEISNAILKELTNAPKENLKELIKYAIVLKEAGIKGFAGYEMNFVGLIRAPKENLKELVELTIALQEAGTKKVSYVVYHVMSDSKEDLKEYIERAIAFKGSEIEEFEGSFSLVELIKNPQCKELFELAIALKETGIDEVGLMIRVLIEASKETILELKGLSKNDFMNLSKVFIDFGRGINDLIVLVKFFKEEGFSSLNELVFRFLKDKLGNLTQNVGNDLSSLRFLVQSIIKKASSYGIDEDDELYQRSLMLLLDMNVNDSDLGNPFTIHKNLFLKKEEAVDLTSLVSAEEIEGELVKCDLGGLRKGMTTISYKQLKEKVPPQSLEKLASRVKQKIADLPQEQKAIVQAYLKDGLEITEDVICNNFIHPLFLPADLMQRGGVDEDKKASLIVQRMYAIAENILKQSDVIPLINSGVVDAIFTPREDLLLRTSASINNCKTGQEEAINNLYRCLPNVGLSGSKDKDQIKKFLENFIQGEMEHKIQEGIGVLQELLDLGRLSEEDLWESSPFQQIVHQTAYVKNLIANDIGLEHPFSFDEHGRCIARELRVKSKKEVLEVFFKHFTANFLVTSLQKKVNEELKEEKNTMYNDINKFLENPPIEEIWLFDEDTYGLTLNKEGALRLLKKIGCIKQV